MEFTYIFGESIYYHVSSWSICCYHGSRTKRNRKKSEDKNKEEQDLIDEKERLHKAELIRIADADRVETERLAAQNDENDGDEPTEEQKMYLDSIFVDTPFEKDFEHQYCKEIVKHLGDDTFKKPMMCHKIAANNALSVLIDRTNQDTDNSLKDNSISTKISQDTELFLYNAGYHKKTKNWNVLLLIKNTSILRNH